MDPNRKRWNEQQQALKKALAKPAAHDQAIELCLGQHAAVHSADGLPAAWSFEDEVWQGLSEAAARRVPAKSEHSIVWMVWHITRIEDMTMNGLIAGTKEVADGYIGADQQIGAMAEVGEGARRGEPMVGAQDNWLARMRAPLRDTGNTSDREMVDRLSLSIDLPILRAYRGAVGRRTREIIQSLTPDDIRRPVSPSALERLLEDGSIAPDALGLQAYWGSLTTAGLLLMPATRHPFVHWNEAMRVKK